MDVAPIGTEDWTTIFTGNREVNAGVLGKFDPSIIADDSYRIRLTATDTSGLSSAIEDQVDVSSQGLKLGNFTLSFTDLSIPIAGIPINVTRTYDSLNARTKDDFGYGWRLEFRDTDLRTSLGPDLTYEELGYRTQAFKEGTKVFITLPGGKRETFTFQPKQVRQIDGLPLGLFASYFYTPEFVSEKGSTNKLSVQKAYITPGNGSNKFYGFQGSPFNPADEIFGNRYFLTTKEGIVYEIDASTGDLVTVSNPNGNKLSFSDAGITASTSLSTGSDSGVSIAFARDAQGKITSVSDPSGQVVKYAYDAKGDLVGVTDRESNTTSFKYAQPTRDHFLTEVVDPLGRSGVKNEYDAQGRLVKLVDALGKPVELAYDPTNSTQTIKDALGNPTTYVYDQRGNVVSEVDANGGVVSRTYDDDNNLLSMTDALGRTTSYSYDGLGNKLSETDALGHTTTYSYNSFGEVLTKVNALGETTRYEYDSRGNRLSLTNAEGKTAKYEFDLKGRPVGIIGADGSKTSFGYDEFGRVANQTDALGRVINYSYDANGNQLTETKSETLANGSTRTLTTEWTYDSNNRVTSTKDALGNITRQEYDKVGNLIVSIDPLGHRTEYEYDAKGQQVKVKYADGTFETTTYDDKGQEIAQTNQLGQTTRTVYDALGRPIESIFADATPNDLTDNPRTKTEYDAAGQIKAQIDERGNRTIFAGCN